MSKIICDICGTSYPDTAEQCPTCGFEKPVTADFMEPEVVDHEEIPETPAREPMKGGRFSKGNVSKRTKSAKKKPAPKEAPLRKPASNSKKKSKNSDRPLIIAIALLLVGIILVGAYIYINYFAPERKPEQTDPPKGTSQQTDPVDTTPPTTTQPIEDTQPVDLSCTGLTLSETSIVLNAAGNSWILNAVPTPANTTDSITYISLDTNVATVDETGKVTAVGNGETEINVICGDLVVTCTVKCDLAPPQETQPDETQPDETQPDETQPDETQPAETQPAETQPQDTGDFKFNTKYGDEVSMSVGDSWTAYVGDIAMEDIQWSVGNTSVATVKNGKVRAVGAGMTTLRAVYNGVEYTCLIRCSE